MAQTAGGTYYAASSELVSSWPATSLDLANQLESRFAAKAATAGPNTYSGTQNFLGATFTGAGLDFIAVGTASSASSIVFTSKFDDTKWQHYRFVISLTGSTGAELLFRLRSGSSDETSANYHRQSLIVNNTSVTAARLSSVTSGRLGNSEPNKSMQIVDVFNPNNAIQKSIVSHESTYSAGTAPEYHVWTSTYNDVGTYDGFTIFPSTGTVTGSAMLFGYRKA